MNERYEKNYVLYVMFYGMYYMKTLRGVCNMIFMMMNVTLMA